MDRSQKEMLKGVFLIVLFVCFVWKYKVVFALLSAIYHVISPLIYGLVIAFLLNLIVRKLEKYMNGGIWNNKTLKRVCSIILSVVIAAGVITIVLVGLIPEIINSVKVLEEKLPLIIQNTATWIENNLHLSGNILSAMENFKIDTDLIDSVLQNDAVMSVLKTSGNVIGSVVGFFGKFLIGIFFAFYVLMQKEELAEKVKRLFHVYLPEKIAEPLLVFCKKADEVYSGFISGQCVDAVILGFMVMVSMLIFGMPYPVLMGVIIAVTALVPVVGAFVGGGIGMFLIAIESPVQSIVFLILFLVLQQIDNKIIYPHVVGSAVGLPSIWIFAAIIVGGNISGVLGMFLGIPVAALVYTFLGENLRKKEQLKKQEAQETEEETTT